MGLIDTLMHRWNRLDPDVKSDTQSVNPGYSSSSSPHHIGAYGYGGSERSIVNAVYNRIAMDVAQLDYNHVKLDESNNFKEIVSSKLNDCLTVEANIDQTSTMLIQDIVMTMFRHGCAAVVPINTTVDPSITEAYEIEDMRVGTVVEWFPQMVKVNIYNELTGQREDILVPKKQVALIENPLYEVINQPNSTVQRLIRKLNLLDQIDEQSGSGKLNLLVRLPYSVKTATRKQQAEERRKDIENQLSDNKYGVAYIDSTESVTQLNRSIDNNMLDQVKYLTEIMYSQLGITDTILNGTCSDEDMMNYYSRTIEPIASAIVDEFKRKFLTKTARSQRHSIMFFRDPFKLVPITQLAEIADKLSRNEIMSSNEIRQKIAMAPVDTERANELLNKNMAAAGQESEEVVDEINEEENTADEYEV